MVSLGVIEACDAVSIEGLAQGGVDAYTGLVAKILGVLGQSHGHRAGCDNPCIVWAGIFRDGGGSLETGPESPDLEVELRQ